MTSSARLQDVFDDACARLAAGLDREAVRSLDLDTALASGTHLRAAREPLDARDVALDDLDRLDGFEVDFSVRRFLGLTAYFGSLWCAYDLAGDFIARVLLDKDKTKNNAMSLNLIGTFFDANKTPGFLPPPVRDVAKLHFGPALGASFHLRNACMHQGFVLHTRAFDGAFVPTPHLKDIADQGAGRVGGVLPAGLWSQNFRESLRLMQGSTDVLVGSLVQMAATMLIEQARHGTYLLARTGS